MLSFLPTISSRDWFTFTFMKNLIVVSILFPLFASSQSKTTAKLDSLFQTMFKKGEPGGAVLIAKDGKIIYKNGFGVADIQTQEPITGKTVFNLGSVSKTFV